MECGVNAKVTRCFWNVDKKPSCLHHAIMPRDALVVIKQLRNGMAPDILQLGAVTQHSCRLSGSYAGRHFLEDNHAFMVLPGR